MLAIDSLTAARISSVLMLDCPPSPRGFCLPPEIWPTIFSHEAFALSIGFVSEKAQGIPRLVGESTDAPRGRAFGINAGSFLFHSPRLRRHGAPAPAPLHDEAVCPLVLAAEVLTHECGVGQLAAPGDDG